MRVGVRDEVGVWDEVGVRKDCGSCMCIHSGVGCYLLGEFVYVCMLKQLSWII